MKKPPGKKVGRLVVNLHREEARGHHDSVDVELRLEIMTGAFHAAYEGQWYTARTRDELADQIRQAASKTADVTWTRYLVVDYEARSWPLAGDSGRPEHGRYETLSIGEDRANPTSNSEASTRVVAAIRLHWSVCEISSPYQPPGDERRTVRMRRELETDDDGRGTYQEVLGYADEQDDDQLPPGAVPWTAEREALLRDVLAALGRLDARLVELFRGDPGQLADRLDTAARARLPQPPDDVLALVAHDDARRGDDLLRESIDRLDLSVRATHLLLNDQISTLSDLIRRSEIDLRHLPHANRKTVNEIIGELAKLGLSLKASKS